MRLLAWTAEFQAEPSASATASAISQGRSRRVPGSRGPQSEARRSVRRGHRHGGGIDPAFAGSYSGGSGSARSSC